MREVAMSEPLLFYDGKTYRLSAEVAADLLSRGVIEPDGTDYALSQRHDIEEVEPFASIVTQPDVPQQPSGPLGHRRLRWFWVLNPRGDARQSFLSGLYRDNTTDEDPRQR
jgi:hypothetical protein